MSWRLTVDGWQLDALPARRPLPTANRQLPTAIALLLLLALPAHSQELTGRALISYQQYQLGAAETSGMRQTYEWISEQMTGTPRARTFA